MMNAQERWKHEYRIFKAFRRIDVFIQHDWNRDDLLAIRREAALERKLAAALRKIEALKCTLEDIATAPYEDQPNDGNEWEKEYYLRGMHR